jgi:hypothetical protein
MENTTFSDDSSTGQTLTVRSGNLAIDVDIEPAVFAATLGDSARTEKEVIKGMGKLIGTHHALGEGSAETDFTGHYARGIQRAAGDNTFALERLQQSLSNVQHYVPQVTRAMASGDNYLEQPEAQAMLTHAHESAEQLRRVAGVTREVDSHLAVPVLNAMQMLGGAQSAADACAEMDKLGPPSNVTYGKAASDLALLLGVDGSLDSPEATAILESEGAGVAMPQFGINATAAFAPQSLFERAEAGDLAAQHALLTEGSMLFEPENEAALERLHELVNAELAQHNGPPDWKSLDDNLARSNQEMEESARTSRRDDSALNSGQPATSRELER